MLGWFTLFREHGAPTFYGENRTPVTIDTHIVGLFSIFVVPAVTFLIILPGVRKHRFTSTFSFLFNMCIGATLLVSLYHPCWHRAETPISTTYKAFSNAKMDAYILVRVGLQYLNISLSRFGQNFFTTTARSRPLNEDQSGTRSDSIAPSPSATHGEDNVVIAEGILYNERFSFSEVNKMEKELSNALVKGLPFPILKVIEYLSGDGFSWGRQYRVAGYYTACMLWLSFYTWIISFVCLAFLPHYFARCIFYTGTFMGIGDLIFVLNIPRQMYIRFPTQDGDTLLKFRLSICFHATCIAAVLCIVVGALLWLLESKNIYHFDTMFSARRHAEGSVVDVYRDDESMTTVLSDQSQLSSKRPASFQSCRSASHASSLASSVYFYPNPYERPVRL
ncbi:hypothetical protein Y032_0023g792 [Ancylostoma ceylanicum]|uniref:DUOXA-like protein C06E1.3 n=1 Tax=Ancylostoma ceylanicum TaxID=53326 RepID=A0A016UX00_9BILA|nr:hypothetical protein Y032_0023g792 [Ancylostoma ceylanicum]